MRERQLHVGPHGANQLLAAVDKPVKTSVPDKKAIEAAIRSGAELTAFLSA